MSITPRTMEATGEQPAVVLVTRSHPGIVPLGPDRAAPRTRATASNGMSTRTPTGPPPPDDGLPTERRRQDVLRSSSGDEVRRGDARTGARSESRSDRTGVGWSRRRDTVADEPMVRQVYEHHGGALLAYATRLTGDRAAAEDVVQETLIRVWQRPDVLTNARGSVRGWLMTVARNIVNDRFRALAARPAEVAEPAEELQGPVLRDHAEEVVDAIVVSDALERLSPGHRQVVTALYFQGRSIAEVAEAVGVPQGTVKSRSHHALRRLRDILAGATFEQAGAMGQ